MIGIFSRGILKIPYIEQFIGSPICRILPFLMPLVAKPKAIAVWGYRPSAVKPARYAIKHRLPLIRLEDGFIRSVGLGVDGAPPLSVVIDHHSMYYDATKPSELELLIQDANENRLLYDTAERAIQFICQHHLSKYNHCSDFEPDILSPAPKVLVLDQTMNDTGIQYGNADANSFHSMLSAAVAENPAHEIWIKTHPDVLTGKKKGYFSEAAILYPHIKFIIDNVAPLSLLKHVDKVYTVTSHMGFEALLLGKEVVTYGQPWYAGWGLTDDRHPQALILSARRGVSSLINLFAAAYLRYCRYINPVTGNLGSIFDVMQNIVLVRRHHLSRSGRLSVPGLSLWKKAILRPYLKTRDNTLSFSAPKPDTTACVVWGVKGENEWRQHCDQLDIPVWRMEDGFLRSVGLGSDLNTPLSLVLDKTGIYYDASRPSDLENILNYLQITPADQERAIALKHYLVESKLSKYNVGKPFALSPAPKNQQVILVPGQVEDDASILTGSPQIKTNQQLLESVRNTNPQAYIVYKPHPDVLAGNRKGHVPQHIMENLADNIATDADIIDCIMQADEVHTMTSLAGFEALLHGKQVTCYGQPFYSGWGLTTDKVKNNRRFNRLTIDALLFGAYILYPTYIHPQKLGVISVEEATNWLKTQPRKQSLLVTSNFSWLQRQSRKVYFLVKTLISGG